MGLFDGFKWFNTTKQGESKDLYNGLIDKLEGEFNNLSFFENITKYRNNVMIDSHNVHRVSGLWKDINTFSSSTEFASRYYDTQTLLKDSKDKIMLVDGDNEGIIAVTPDDSPIGLNFWRKYNSTAENLDADIVNDGGNDFTYSNNDLTGGVYSSPNKMKLYQLTPNSVLAVVFLNANSANGEISIFLKTVTYSGDVLTVADYKTKRILSVGSGNVRLYTDTYEGVPTDCTGCTDFVALTNSSLTNMETYIDYDIESEQLFVRQTAHGLYTVIGRLDFTDVDVAVNPFYLMVQYQQDTDDITDYIDSFVDTDDSTLTKYHSIVPHYRVFNYYGDIFRDCVNTTNTVNQAIQYDDRSGKPLNLFKGDTYNALVSLIRSNHIRIVDGKIFINKNSDIELSNKSLTEVVDYATVPYSVDFLFYDITTSINTNIFKQSYILTINTIHIIGRSLPFEFKYSFKNKSIIVDNKSVYLLDLSTLDKTFLYDYFKELEIDTTYVDVDANIGCNNFYYGSQNKNTIASNERVGILYPSKSFVAFDYTVYQGHYISFQNGSLDSEGVRLYHSFIQIKSYTHVVEEGDEGLFITDNTILTNLRNIKVLGYLQDDIFIPVQ